MKKMIFASLLLLGATAYGQTKGSWYLGGSAGFSMRSTTQGNATLKYHSWSASPEAGVFLTDHIQLGLGATSNGYTNGTSGNTTTNSLQFGGTVYSRYLFGETAFRPFLGISAGYLAGQTQLSPASSKTNIGTINATFTAGFAYYITPRISVFGSIGMLGYTNTRTEMIAAPDQVVNEFGFNLSTLGNRFNIGMYYTICKGKSAE